MRGATTPGLADAAADDLPGLVAHTSRSPAAAFQLVVDAGVPDALAVELLGDAYFALGREADARAIAHRGSGSTRFGCTIDLRDALAHVDPGLGKRLDEVAHGPCAEAAETMRCQLELSRVVACASVPPNPPAKLAAALAGWFAPTEVGWQAAADRAVAAMPLPGAEAVAVAALANALVVDCATRGVAAVAATATALRARPDHDPKLDPHLAILAHATSFACRATHHRHQMP